MEKKDEGENGIGSPDPETRRIREAYRRLELDPVTGRSIRKAGTFKLYGWSSNPGHCPRSSSSSTLNCAARKRKPTDPETTQEPGQMHWEPVEPDQGRQQKPRLDEVVTTHPVEPGHDAENGGETEAAGRREVEIPEAPRQSIFSMLNNFRNSSPFPQTVVDSTLTKGIAKMKIDAP